MPRFRGQNPTIWGSLGAKCAGIPATRKMRVWRLQMHPRLVKKKYNLDGNSVLKQPLSGLRPGRSFCVKKMYLYCDGIARSRAGCALMWANFFPPALSRQDTSQGPPLRHSLISTSIDSYINQPINPSATISWYLFTNPGFLTQSSLLATADATTPHTRPLNLSGHSEPINPWSALNTPSFNA